MPDETSFSAPQNAPREKTEACEPAQAPESAPAGAAHPASAACSANPAHPVGTACPVGTPTSAQSVAAPAASAHSAVLPEKLSFFHLFWIFIICSMVGLVAETLVSYPIDGIWKDRAGLVWGPFSPIYGAGGTLITLALWRLKNERTRSLFIASAFIGAGFEYIAGWFWETFFGIVAWSYVDQPFNLGGHTCLGMAIVWGFAGLAWARIALPGVLRVIERIPRPARVPLTTIACLYMAANIAMTIASFNFWFERQDGRPIETPIQAYFAQNYGDDFMAERFQTMSIYADLAKRGGTD